MSNPILASITLPMPSDYKATYGYRKVRAVMADGTPRTALVHGSAKHRFTLSWRALTSSDRDTVQQALDGAKGGSVSYTDIEGNTHTVETTGGITWTVVKTAMGYRYSGSIDLEEV